jgi:DNA invertase Pin-like site-specific DNA recombinase
MSIPAAQYLRMSTEHQQYSINNQARLISEYANLQGFVIVKTFEDSGKSGLSLKSRPALKQLLNDVVSGSLEFKVILVYDVSRWGRFQDVDEAAHYEFLCRSSGIPIHYCAEQFVNQGTMESSILKTLKRAMAAEFSRELGEKVYRGQSQLVRMGFKMGGRSTYGLRRMLVSSEGCPKQLLGLGERKSIHNDRVIVVPGPQREVAVVREIFAMAQNGMRPQSISENLNRRGVHFSEARPDWNRQTVANLIRNPVYAGCNAWGRTSQRLKQGNHDLPTDQWILAPNSFESIVDIKTFDAARQAIEWKLSDTEILEGLRTVWKKHGAVTQAILAADENAPSYMSCKYHFGTLKAALELIGYSHNINYILARARGKEIQRKHRKFVQQIASRFPSRIQVVSEPHSPKRSLLLDGTLRIHVQFAIPRETSPHHVGWRICPRSHERKELNLCCYLNPENNRIQSMYFLCQLPSRTKTTVTVHPDSVSIPHSPLRSISWFCSSAHAIAARYGSTFLVSNP